MSLILKYGTIELDKVLEDSMEEENDKKAIREQYVEFKKRTIMLLSDSSCSYAHLHTENQHLLWETHKCTDGCNVRRQVQCADYQKVLEPKEVRTMKVLHLFLKSETFYEGLPNFLHLFLCCYQDTHRRCSRVHGQLC